MFKQPLIYIIILNWNGWQDTLKCLESLQTLNYQNYVVLIIDNGSENDSVEQIKSCTTDRSSSDLYFEQSEVSISLIVEKQIYSSLTILNKNILLITSSSNLGFSGGCNLGITYSLQQMADYVFLLNNDASVHPDIFNHLLRASKAANAAVVGARVLDEKGEQTLFAGKDWPAPIFVSGTAFFKLEQQFWESTYVEGSSMLLRRDLLEQRLIDNGYFLDPSLFMYGEDVDISIYARHQGYKCLIARDAIIYHKASKISGGQGNPRTYYYCTRNRIYLANCWLSLPEKALFHIYYVPSRLIIILIKIFLKPQNLNVARAIISGLLDGYRGVKDKWVRH